jgi:hypothetical protein
MAGLKKFSRELAPHAAWRGIELVWELMRAAIIAAVIAGWQWFTHHWDISTIVLVFVVCLGLLAWRDYSSRRSYNFRPDHEDLPVTPNATPTTYHEVMAGELKEQVNKLTKERDDLHSELARVNQHRIDLLGTNKRARNDRQQFCTGD